MNIYIYELIIWLVLMLFVIFWFRFMTKKIKDLDDLQSKNSFFTIMLLLGIPVLLFEIIAPITILMGDKVMPLIYKLVFGAEILAVIIYFISTQRHKKAN